MNRITKLIMPLVLILGLSISCSSSSDDSDSDSGKKSTLTLTSSRTSTSMIEKAVFVFTVTNNKGEDVTASTKLYINDKELSSSEFTPTEAGEYTVIAKTTELTSNTVSISVTETPYFAHKVLIEDFTGAGCGWCPRVSKAIELAEEATDKVIAVAIHNPVFGPDPFTFKPRTVLENKLGVKGYPTAFINRNIAWKAPENTNYDIPTKAPHLKENSPIGIKIESNVSANAASIDISLFFKESFQNLKYVVFIVEDGLKYKQTNYTNLYGGGATLPDFIHNNTLRATSDTLLGTDIDATSTAKNSQVKINALIGNFVTEDIKNVKVVVAILDENGAVLNVQTSAANQTVDFEYAK